MTETQSSAEENELCGLYFTVQFQLLWEAAITGESAPVIRESGGDRSAVTGNTRLVTFAEVIAMYLLVWSPTPWTLITPKAPQLSPEEQKRYAREQVQIDIFRDGLPGVARVFAHLSVACRPVTAR